MLMLQVVDLLKVIMEIHGLLTDRMKLMEWGGYYKLNSYFYAPKDDPKHNSKWRELYTERRN